jgi:hypothetical protein
MKYLIPVVLGGAAAVVAITDAVAQAHGAFNGRSSLTPFLLGYGVAGALLLLALAFAINAHRQESLEQKPKSEGTLKFVLDVVGNQPLSSQLSDWRFLLQNCGSRTARYVRLAALRSEIGAYELCFKEIPALLAGEKVVVYYEVYPRRDDERGKKATLWDFGKDHAGERGHTFIWYDIQVQYQEADDSIRDAGIVSVCFDLEKQILKTEGVEFWNEKKRMQRG